MIKFRCDQCHNLIEVDEKFVGKAGSCQKCGAPVVVPQPEVSVSTGLDSLRDAADAPGAEHYGAYGKARDAAWKDPAAATPAPPKPEEPAVPLPDIPAEIIAAAKARKRQNMQYIIGAALVTLIVLVLLFPLLAPKPKEAPKPIAPAPAFGQDPAQQEPAQSAP